MSADLDRPKLQLKVFVVSLVVFAAGLLLRAAGDPLVQGFERPPVSAQPWTFWFWMNGNITREGITADLEAMAGVGIHGAVVFDVAKPKQMAPDGPVPFGTPEWRALFAHAAREAQRLGMELGMCNDAGWCGSGGPWNTPEFSMQKLVSTTTHVSGPRHWDGVLPQPEAFQNFYRDLRVLAFPVAGDEAVNGSAATIPLGRVVDLTANMDANGRLSWEVPEGTWAVRRLGHTSNGRMNHPAPESGVGLECDKFSAEAVQRHFDGFIGKLVTEVGAGHGSGFTLTHIDSWEVGVQDWTPRMREEFLRRRGYDLVPWLVPLTGGPTLENAEVTRRFQRDFKRTQSELVSEAYAGAMRALAQRHGIGLSLEAYGPTGAFLNPLEYATHADVPMAEFWVSRWGAWHLLSGRLVSSAVHSSGGSVVAAESFTAMGDHGSWTEHPYSIKTVGDWAFSQGVNRFVFHRTVLQPWTGFEPGMTFGPYGTHFDRNQTWWAPGAAFMHYLARCQYVLQQGQFVADVCRLLPDGEEHGSNETHAPSLGMATLPSRYTPVPSGYNHDYVSDTTLLDGATVKDGRIVVRSGMNYRVLQLPESTDMTPELLAKVRALVQAGAVVVGPAPRKSPSLRDYPGCDARVSEMAREVWGDCDGKRVTEHGFGAGRVYYGRPLEEILKLTAGGPDIGYAIDPLPTDDTIMSVTLGRGKSYPKEPVRLMPTDGLNWIHRRVGATDVYFLANPQHRTVGMRCSFRVGARQPELWDPETGEVSRPAQFAVVGDRTELTIPFASAGAVFVVFRDPAIPAQMVVAATREAGSGHLSTEAPPAASVQVTSTTTGAVVEASQPGRYAIRYSDGHARTIELAAPPAPVAIAGPWHVAFQPGRGAPANAEFASLCDWAGHQNDGIRYFSGTATYTTDFEWQPEPGGNRTVAYLLDLGRVEVMAEVRVNGTDMGVLWKPPFKVVVTNALRPGRNQLEVRVTNLWVNRLIGDEQYPDDCTPDGSWKSGALPAWPDWFLQKRPRPEPRRLTFTTWKYFTAETPLVPSGLIGPVALRAIRRIEVK